jgi:hypothetical protein
MEPSVQLHVEAQSLLICVANYLSLGQFELAWVCLQELCGYDKALVKELLQFLASSGKRHSFLLVPVILLKMFLRGLGHKTRTYMDIIPCLLLQSICP